MTWLPEIPGYYILVGRLPVPCPQMEQWAAWYATADRTVAKTQIGCLWISTVFLGFDHAFGDVEPMLFETMIFDEGEDIYQTRCETWSEAEAMHEVAVVVAEQRVRAADQVVAEIQPAVRALNARLASDQGGMR